MDVAILLGELNVRGNADWRWGIDLDPLSLKRDMTSARRVVLLADPVGDHHRAFVTDIEDIVVGRFQRPNEMQYTLGNPWRTAVVDGIEGARMAFWRAQASGGANPSGATKA